MSTVRFAYILVFLVSFIICTLFLSPNNDIVFRRVTYSILKGGAQNKSGYRRLFETS